MGAGLDGAVGRVGVTTEAVPARGVHPVGHRPTGAVVPGDAHGVGLVCQGSGVQAAVHGLPQQRVGGWPLGSAAA
eukprot:1827670-Pyramimonas_sp.AAC.1